MELGRALRAQQLPEAAGVILTERLTETQRGIDLWAAVKPLNSDSTADVSEIIRITRYRLTLYPHAAELLTPAEDVKLDWRGNSYVLEGDLEQHTADGFIHHLEAIMRRLS